MVYSRRGCFKCGNGNYYATNTTYFSLSKIHKVVSIAYWKQRHSFSFNLVGHFADVCPEPERLCYNCKQPGHESSQCPRPRTTDAKQCFTCGGGKSYWIFCYTIDATKEEEKTLHKASMDDNTYQTNILII